MKFTEDQKAQLLANSQRHLEHENEDRKVALVLAWHRFMDTLELPDEVELRVLRVPAEILVDQGRRYDLMAMSRRLRYANYMEDTVPWVEDVRREIEADLLHAKAEGCRLVYAPYWLPYMTPSFLDPKDFTVNRGWLLRYAKKKIPLIPQTECAVKAYFMREGQTVEGVCGVQEKDTSKTTPYCSDHCLIAARTY